MATRFASLRTVPTGQRTARHRLLPMLNRPRSDRKKIRLGRLGGRPSDILSILTSIRCYFSKAVDASPKPTQTKEPKLKKKVGLGRLASCFGNPTDRMNNGCFVLVVTSTEAALVQRLRSMKPEYRARNPRLQLLFRRQNRVRAPILL